MGLTFAFFKIHGPSPRLAGRYATDNENNKARTSPKQIDVSESSSFWGSLFRRDRVYHRGMLELDKHFHYITEEAVI